MEKLTIAALLGALLLVSAGFYFLPEPSPPHSPPLQLIPPSEPKLSPDIIGSLNATLSSHGGKVLTPEHPDFAEFTTPWEPKCLDRPYVVFAAATEEDTAAVLREINKAGERFSIMSGGHDSECQSTTKHVLLTNKLLKKVTVDTQSRTIAVQAGARWKEVYAKLNNTGYLVVGGSCPTVGVSGFTLGGGFNWFLSRYYGIAAENTLALKAVLASGELVTVTWDNEYSDLAWGLLGSGGQQLAMVLEFTYRIHPADTYTVLKLNYLFTDDGTATSYPVQQFKRVFKRWVHSVQELEDNPAVGGVTIEANRDETKGLGVRRYEMSVFGVCRGCDWGEFIKGTVQRFPPTFYDSVKSSSSFQEFQASFAFLDHYPAAVSTDRPCAFLSHLNDDTTDALVDFFAPDTREEGDTVDTGVHIEAIMIKGAVKDPIHTSLGPAKVSWKLHAAFKIPSQADIKHGDAVTGRWNKEIMKAAGSDYLGGYINYFDMSLGKKHYYGDNLKKLKKIKAKYDPENRFQRAKGISQKK